MKYLSPDQKIKDFEYRQRIISILLFLIFCGTAIVINNIHLSRVADDNTKLLSRLFSIGDQREIVHILQQAHLSNFDVIRYQSSNPEKSFIIPAIAETYENRNPLNSLITDKVTIPVTFGIDKSSTDTITFEFSRLKLIPYAVILWLLLLIVSVPQLSYLKKRLKEKYSQELELEKKAAKSELAHEIRHNLRTPLAALMRIPSRLPEIANTEKDLLKNTIYQIQELISKLDDKKAVTLFDEAMIYDSLYQAKGEIGLSLSSNINFTFKIDDSLISANVNHVPFELRAILSNLVNNSSDAIDKNGKIIIKVTDRIDSLEISVTDNGSGISPEVLPRVFEKNFSHGKTNGSGIGLSHAKEFIESWNGSIVISSSLGFGTIVKIILPIENRKSWHLPRLKMQKDSDIFILDDQQLNLDLWKLKFNDLRIDNKIYYAQTPAEMHQMIRKSDSHNPVFLFDYDLKDSITGLDLLNTIPRTSVRCLVTGHFDNKEIQDQCSKSEIYLLPKSQISELPIVSV